MKTRYTLTTLEKNSIREFMDTRITEQDMKHFYTLEKAVVPAVWELVTHYNTVFCVDYIGSYIAYALAYTAKKALDVSVITVMSYIHFYADTKRKNEQDISDYGAFGDLLELLVRLAFIGNLHLVHSTALHVKEQAKTDVISSKYGKLEIGHNGKTWTQATVFDFMNGNFEGVVYGMFSDIEKQEIYDLCACGKIPMAIQYVKEYMCYWSNKYDYLKDMDNLTRGKGVTIKSNQVQTVYNDSKYLAFEQAIENKEFTTLADIL